MRRLRMRMRRIMRRMRTTTRRRRIRKMRRQAMRKGQPSREPTPPLGPCQADSGNTKGDGDKKNVTKNRLLMGFLADPELGESFMKVVSSITFSEEVSQNETWLTKKQLKDVYSSSEAEEMIAEGKIQA
eukprot:4138832-Pyramimonas_sp.AAC.1